MFQMNDDIQTVLAAYDAAAARAEGTPLEDWVHRHPEHAGGLTQYAVYNYVFERGAAYVVDTTGEKSLFLARAASIRERMMREERLDHAMAGQPATRSELQAAYAGPLTSLLHAARAKGLPVPVLAQSLEISPVEVVKLNQRLFRATTLPRALVARLANLLDRSVQEVAAYLRQPAMLAAEASYKAEAAPRLAAQEDFQAAIAASRNLTDAQKARWLAVDEDLLGDAEE